jgi:ribonuclease BN (tRNA processing enzyme)
MPSGPPARIPGDRIAMYHDERRMNRRVLAMSLRHIFMTHHLSDHNADYGTLLQLAWAAGLATRGD